MPLELYYYETAPPSRAVVLLVKTLKLPINLRRVDLSKNENQTPDFIKMNPLKKVPVLNDNGIYISDSHAILTYLTSQYGMNSSHLYPRDLKKRAIVDSRLHFDNGVLFPSLANIIRPMVYEGQTTILEDKKKIALEALDFVEGLLKQTEWVAGDKMTVADFSLVATVTSLATLLPEVESYWKIQAWIKRCEKNMIFYEEEAVVSTQSTKSLANRNAAPK
ncbi:hypothetical protein M8J77_014703 [Diaphorina citri]|nr:hypothetical protein M8J77_014703 [Diaphorina citri]